MNEQAASLRAADAPVRVLILISTHIVGGPGKGLLQLIPLLAARGHTVPVLCTFRNGKRPETPFVEAARERGISIACVAQRFNLDWRAFPQLLGLARRERIDLIQTHGYKEHLFGLMLKMALRKPWVCVVHGTTDENLKVRAYHALGHAVMRFADRIVSVSRELASRTIPRAAESRLTVVPNAIDPDPPQVDALALARWRRNHDIVRRRVIACVGRLSPEKGQDVLLRAAAALRKSGRGFQLLLVGGGPARAALERKCLQLGLRAHVTFLGEQAHVDLVYAAAELLVLPSRKEGMPNVILEAMRHQLPVLATCVGAVPEMLRDGREAILVPPGDALALARGLAALLDDPGRAKTLGRAAHAALARFSPEQRAQRMESVYQDLVKGR